MDRRNRSGFLAATMLLAGVFFLGGALLPVRQDDRAESTPIQVPPLLPAGRASSIDATIEALQDRLRNYPEDAAGFASLGLAYLTQGRTTVDPSWFPKAEEAFLKALSLDRERGHESLIGMAVLANARHDFATALKWGNRAVAFDAYDAQARGAVGDALVELGRYDAAFKTYQHMINLRPDLASFARVAYARELLGDVKGAFRAWRDAERSRGTPTDLAWVNYQVGDLRLRSGQTGRAERYFHLALELTPDSHQASVGLARVAAARGQWPRAKRILRDVTRRYPSPAYVALLGDVYLRAGDPDTAQEQYSLVLAQQKLAGQNDVLPDVETTLFNIDRGYDAEATLAEARARYELQPNIRAADALGWALWARGQAEDALPYAREALRLGTRDASFHYHLGVILHDLGHGEPALDHLRKALAIDPSFSVLHAPKAKELIDTWGSIR